MSRPALLVAAALAYVFGGCETQNNGTGLFGPCERSKDCTGGLTCEAGLCVAPSPEPVDGSADGLNDSDLVDGSTTDQ